MPLLDIDAVNVFYGDFQALSGVSISLEAGDVLALIGANGAGKTTLLRVISGLLRPTSGTMVMEGQDLVRMPAHRIVETGVPRLSIDDVCLYYRRHGGGLTGPMIAGERSRAHLASWAHILKRSLDRRRA